MGRGGRQVGRRSLQHSFLGVPLILPQGQGAKDVDIEKGQIAVPRRHLERSVCGPITRQTRRNPASKPLGFLTRHPVHNKRPLLHGARIPRLGATCPL